MKITTIYLARLSPNHRKGLCWPNWLAGVAVLIALSLLTGNLTGEVTRVIDTFGSLNEPTRIIPAEVTALTGITDEMVAGQKIDPAVVESFVSDAAIIIAHNANFDRRFAERCWITFVEKPWACSVNQVDWRAHGFEGSRLAYLLVRIGIFYQAHRAAEDCRALLEVLAHRLLAIDKTVLGVLLENARK